MVEIKNLPRSHRKYVVARKVAITDAEAQDIERIDYWFWGCYDTEEEAYPVAEEIQGQVFVRGEQ